jgi:phospholipid transport system substrate-binding protein
MQYRGKNMLRNWSQWALALASLSLLSMPVLATATEVSAYDIIELTTERIMLVVEAASEYADEDPERYYRELQPLLDEVVDFAGFSRAVMGDYASKQRYQSLGKDGKKELRGQVERFTAVMRTGLVRTYGKGLIAFGGSKAEVQRPEGVIDEGSTSMSVTQLIYGDSAEPYVILYQMRKSKRSGWKLRNLIVETINLGVIYRNQFQAAAQDNEGDINAVIKNWSAPPEEDDLGDRAENTVAEETSR